MKYIPFVRIVDLRILDIRGQDRKTTAVPSKLLTRPRPHFYRSTFDALLDALHDRRCSASIFEWNDVMRGFFLGAALAVAMSAPAAAAVVIEESADFSNDASAPTSLGTLALGSTSIAGRLSANCEGGPTCFGGDARDSIAFVIDDGMQLSAASLVISGLPSDGARAFYGGLSTSGESTGGNRELLDGKDPLTGTLSFLLAAGRGQTSANRVAYDWELRLVVSHIPDVTPIPLPAGLPLLLAGAGALALLRRRAAER